MTCKSFARWLLMHRWLNTMNALVIARSTNPGTITCSIFLYLTTNCSEYMSNQCRAHD
ncbi:hypothetical protein PR003_g5897 [Phytophthora rubi]|uniref:RxLR effector protein n=1 Tax=Phytophthora rubi TaxID=129364 RepID=A0A6A4FS72_9STRA|nr:hypothetical protein PR002_g14691 [Phytophthora rubi]KAE9349415.1 hypothetical protein PR003_g5897 [Phytophthora rubi]